MEALNTFAMETAFLKFVDDKEQCLDLTNLISNVGKKMLKRTHWLFDKTKDHSDFHCIQNLNEITNAIRFGYGTWKLEREGVQRYNLRSSHYYSDGERRGGSYTGYFFYNLWIFFKFLDLVMEGDANADLTVLIIMSTQYVDEQIKQKVRNVEGVLISSGANSC